MRDERIRTSGLCASVEGDGAVGSVGGPVAGVVGPAVVPGTQADAFVDGGRAAVGPTGLVVGVESRGAVAALGAAAVVADEDREALGLGVQPAFAAEVEGLAVAAED